MSNSKRRRIAAKHFIHRAKERHGIDLSSTDILEINQAIWAGNAKDFSEPERKVRYLYVAHKGIALPVTYHTGIRSVVTVLGDNFRQVRRALSLTNGERG